MIQMQVRDEYGRWRLSVCGQIGTQRFLAAVHHQQRLAVALKYHACRAQFRCSRIADAQEIQDPFGGIGRHVWHGMAAPVAVQG